MESKPAPGIPKEKVVASDIILVLGIEKDRISQIFTMFKTLHTYVEGTGLVLYILKRIIENSRGKIEVDCEPGKGTTFHFYLNA